MNLPIGEKGNVISTHLRESAGLRVRRRPMGICIGGPYDDCGVEHHHWLGRSYSAPILSACLTARHVSTSPNTALTSPQNFPSFWPRCCRTRTLCAQESRARALPPRKTLRLAVFYAERRLGVKPATRPLFVVMSYPVVPIFAHARSHHKCRLHLHSDAHYTRAAHSGLF